MTAATFHSERGMSLVEVTIALGLLAFCLIVLLGLLPTGLSAVRDGVNDGAAVNLLSEVGLDIFQTTNPSAISPVFGVPAVSDSPIAVTKYCNESGAVLSGVENARFRVQITPRDSGNPRLGIWHVAVISPAQTNAAVSISAETLVAVPRG